jgi:lipopolysaccharide exporter
MSFIGSSISQVFFQRASEAKSEDALALMVENTFRLLVIIGMFPILTLTIVGSDVFSVIFGEIWTEAGVYAQILSIWVFVWFISSPLSTLYIIMEKQQFGLKFNIVNFITRLGSVTKIILLPFWAITIAFCIIIDLFMAYKYPIFDVFHWFCKIARFFATEPKI